MITTILDVLVAVVVLIVIIAVAALHFLRADDSDTFDDMPEEPRRNRRHPAEPAAEPALVPAGRGRSRQPEPATELFAASGRGARPADDRGRPAKPERPSGRPASGQRPTSVPAKQAAARQAQAARTANPDSGASEWDKLSDVDYWAELASDKPIAPAAAASSDSPRSRRGADQKGDARSASRGELAQLPVRGRSRSRSGPAPRPADTGITEQIDVRAARSGGRYGSEPTTQGLAALARLADQPPGLRPPNGQRQPNGQSSGQRQANGRPTGSGQRPTPTPDRRALPAGPLLPGTGQRPALPQAPAAQISHSGGHARPPQPLDDDPLTSPSFPAINTSDSRSYRTRRPSSSWPSTAQHSGSQPAGSPRPNGHGAGSYSDPAQPYSPYPSAPDRSSSLPNGYPAQPAAASAAGSSYSGNPVANPYGSFVDAPGRSPATPAPVPAPTPHFDAAAYGSGYAAGQQAVAGVNWYASTPEVSYESQTYQDGHSAQPGGNGPGHVAGHYDQRGYGGPELTYGQDGYQGYTGYGGSGR